MGKIALAVFIGLVAGIMLMAGGLALRNREPVAPISIVPPEPTATALPTNTPQPIQVFVSGEVRTPDVYALAPGSRIKQLVEVAGGFTDKADTEAVNLAQPLTDGVHVHIPAEGALDATPHGLLTTPAPLRGSAELDIGSGGGLVNINSAGADELETLPGIGPITAQKILNYRAANGSFADIAAIMEVPGIGEAKYEQIKDLITTAN